MRESTSIPIRQAEILRTLSSFQSWKGRYECLNGPSPSSVIQSTQLVLGALIAGFVGYVVNAVQQRQELRRARQAWGTLLYDQLISQPPRKYPINDDPPTVPLLTYSAIPHLLQPGILKLPKEGQLQNFLSFLESAVNEYNYKGQSYNAAWQSSVDWKMLQVCMNNVAIDNIDFSFRAGQWRL